MDETLHRAVHDLGTLLKVYTGLPLLSIAVALALGERYVVPAFAVTGAVIFCLGRVLEARFDDSSDSGLAAGVVTVSVGWFLAAVCSALPFVLVAWTVSLAPGPLSTPAMTPTLETLGGPVDALFEGMSGVTGTGFSMATDPGDLPRSLQWWRSLLQWVGGIGVVVLAAAFASSEESASFRAIHGNMAPTEHLRSTTRGTAAALWSILAFLTVVCALLLWLAGMGPWAALNHAMTGVTTGGFTITEESVASYASSRIELALLPVMTVGAVSFSVLFFVLRGDRDRIRGDAQTRWLFGGLALGALLTTLLLVGAGVYGSTSESFRYGTFQFVSALTCTGFQTQTVLGDAWTAPALFVVVGGMIVGGAAGSTAGGIKLVRVRRTLLEAPNHGMEIYESSGAPDATVGNTSVDFDSAAIIALLWFVFLGVSTFVALTVLPADYATADVLFEVASAQGNVGLSAGVVDHTVPDALKLSLVLSMWIGRLEIIPVVVTAKVIVDHAELDLGGVVAK